MANIKITANISQDESEMAQRENAAKCACTWEQERYVSSDGKSALNFQFQEEIAFGPPLFRATLEKLGGTKKGLSSKAGARCLLSSGRYGQGYDHWDGDPWSPDSRQLVLFDFLKRGADGLGAVAF